jgi:hypothetical protein
LVSPAKKRKGSVRQPSVLSNGGRSSGDDADNGGALLCSVGACQYTAVSNADLTTHTQSHFEYKCISTGCWYGCNDVRSFIRHARKHVASAPNALAGPEPPQCF